MKKIPIISLPFLFFSFSSFQACLALDFITSSQNLSDGYTLVSEKGLFELGFFSPVSSSKNRYLGIWYKTISIPTVIWVANRENPINDSSGVLKINTTGNEIVLMQNDSMIWSAKSLNPIRNPRLQLLESGNLVLKDDNSEDFQWQSFDFSIPIPIPTDALSLPGMKLGWDLKKGIINTNRRLSETTVRDYCDTHGLCGAYGSCNIEITPACECLKGFRPRMEEKWNLQVYTDGCVRNRELNCSDKVGFAKLSGLKLPDTKNSWVNESMNLSECREKCLRNCSCVAFAANTDMRGSGSGCAIWFGELLDIKVPRAGGQDLYVRMLASDLEKKNTKMVVVGIVVAVAIVVIVALVCVGYCIIRTRKPLEGKDFEGQEDDLELPMFDLSTISNATDNFAIYNKLGEGGFGSVFKGKLTDGQEIAVKRLSTYSRQGTGEFKNEVILIAKLQHRNLVKLLGCCIQGDEKMLVYEYMPNNSLDSFIFDPAKKKLLDWCTRYNIIFGVARGILYLHQDSRLRIIHRDLKASNVLLDIDMNPKISDFGMARTFGGNQTEGNTRRVVGTYGYMAPEYAIDGQFSIKSDVFSFGILLLEIISGEKNRGFYRPHHALNLVGHAWKLWNDGRALELIDTSLGESYSLSEVVRCIHVSLLCLQQHPEDRPTMSNVVLMLSCDSALAQPKQPGFYMEKDNLLGDSLSTKNESSTTNELTITHLEAR